jgi:hypothetical protein
MNILRKLFGTNSTAKVNTARLSHNYPNWEQVTHLRNEQWLQDLHSLDDAKKKHLHECSSCPTCGATAEQLVWLYSSEPMPGGWITVCDRDEMVVDFFRGEFYPWENVDASRNDALLQAKNTLDPSIIKGSTSCPNCGLASEQLSWFWFSSPQEDWDALAGRAGWMSVCDTCHIQVEFLDEIMS